VRSTDAALFATLLQGHQVLVYADAWYNGELAAPGLRIKDGSIEFDLGSDVQGVLHLTVEDPTGDLVALKDDDPLAVYGQEIQIRYAVSSSGAAAETDPIGLGWYRIQTNETNETWLNTGDARGVVRAGAEIILEGLDRVSILEDARLLTLAQPAAGATCLGEIARLTNDLVPLGVIGAGIVDVAVPRSVVYTEDRVAAIRDLANALGAMIRVNGDGALDIRKPTVAGADSVWFIETASAGVVGSLSSYRSVMTRDGVVNAVVAQGETGTDHAPVQAIAYDMDPGSPTVWDGPYGEVPAFFSSPLLTTTAMAQAAATTRLDSYRRGRDRTFVLDIIPNPLLELDDPVFVQLPDRYFIGRIVKISLPLTPGPAKVTVRTLVSAITTGGGGGSGGNVVTLINPGAQSWTDGSAISAVTISGSSSGGGVLTYTATGLPAGLSISSGGVITGTPTTGAASGSCTVTGTDSTSATGTTTFSWTVAAAGGGVVGSSGTPSTGADGNTTFWGG
jgi:Putative Ig domain